MRLRDQVVTVLQRVWDFFVSTVWWWLPLYLLARLIQLAGLIEEIASRSPSFQVLSDLFEVIFWPLGALALLIRIFTAIWDRKRLGYWSW